MGKDRIKECRFLVPVHRDVEISDGGIHDPASWNWLHEQMRQRFSGWTRLSGKCVGEWISDTTGEIIADQSVQYFVAVPTTRLPLLRDLLRDACVVFGQQCIYLSIGGFVEFVEAET